MASPAALHEASAASKSRHGVNAASSKSASPANTAPSVGAKRKRDSVVKFYAVRVGKAPGIYHSWSDCLEQVKGHKGALFKSFPSLTDAEAFLSNDPLMRPVDKYYAVKSGKTPGVYTDWPSAQAQITGWQKPQHKSFATRAEAEAFLRGAEENGTPRVNESPGPNAQSFSHRDSGAVAASTLATKKRKISSAQSNSADYPNIASIDHSIQPGTGPLPLGAEDDFDPRIILNPETGKMQYKTDQQRQATKLQARPGTDKDNEVRIYTDGSSLGNGQHGAVAGVGVWFGPADARNVSEALVGPRQTNQRAELTALLRAIEVAPKDRNIRICSDSKYGIKCVTEWFQQWRRNNWANAGGKPVENKDLIEKILNKIDERVGLGSNTEFEWLKGHANDPGNEAADRLAVGAANLARDCGR